MECAELPSSLLAMILNSFGSQRDFPEWLEKHYEIF